MPILLLPSSAESVCIGKHFRFRFHVSAEKYEMKDKQSPKLKPKSAWHSSCAKKVNLLTHTHRPKLFRDNLSVQDFCYDCSAAAAALIFTYVHDELKE